ncbi:preprotein translocase subunit SecE [Actinoplanes sp. GCM10030250]|uniref:preprotein translocase subunit SecE n=1 Tax=Actinoplanes sp. GCM10030250 TaxID=3273376 RepID=UPI00361ED255
MAEKDRPGDDVPGDDEVFADAADGDVPDDDVDDAPVSRGGGTAVAERTKDSDSPKAKSGRRTGLFGRVGGFFREVISELRKVIWPTRKELLTYTGVVIVFVVVMTAIVAGLDYGLGKAILWALG